MSVAETETEGETTTTKAAASVAEEGALPKNAEDLELRHAWTLWLKFAGAGEERAAEVGTARTARQFWGLYNPVGLLARANHTATAARGLGLTVTAPTKCDVFLMRAGVRPEWEDAAHADGGFCSFRVPRRADAGDAALAATLASVVSGQDAFEGVTGVNARVRPALVGIDVWHRRGAAHALRRALEGVIARAHIACDAPPDGGSPVRCLTWRVAARRAPSAAAAAAAAADAPADVPPEGGDAAADA